MLRRVIGAKKHTTGEICQMVGISRPTLYAYVRKVEGG
jgi:AcrR family transcriptional regulator